MAGLLTAVMAVPWRRGFRPFAQQFSPESGAGKVGVQTGVSTRAFGPHPETQALRLNVSNVVSPPASGRKDQLLLRIRLATPASAIASAALPSVLTSCGC